MVFDDDLNSCDGRDYSCDCWNDTAEIVGYLRDVIAAEAEVADGNDCWHDIDDD